MRPEILVDALRRAGANFEGENAGRAAGRITKADMYARGLSGRPGSAEARAELIAELGLPKKLTADGLLDVLNAVTTREEFLKMP
jgi:ribonuclease M5